MAFGHGKAGIIKIGDSGNTLRDFSIYLTGADVERVIDTAETTTLGATGKTYIPGVPDATFSFDGNFDPTPDGWLNGIVGLAARTWQIGPQGQTTGLVRYSGVCILTSYKPGGITVQDVVGFSAKFQNSGAVTVDTWP